jgi:hypothetical protein
MGTYRTYGNSITAQDCKYLFKCEWVKHPNDVSVDNYGLTLVDLKNLGHKDDLWVLADRVAQVFYVHDPETGKHVVVSGKQKIDRVENVEDNDAGINQFEEMTLKEAYALYAKMWQ